MSKKKWIKVRKGGESKIRHLNNLLLVTKKEAERANCWLIRGSALGWQYLRGQRRSARVRRAKNGRWLAGTRHNGGQYYSTGQTYPRKIDAKRAGIAWVWGR